LTQLPGGAPPRVLVDTDVFSYVYVKHPIQEVGSAWARALTGRTVVIAVQTEVELRAWPLLYGWGQPRTQALITRIEAVPRIQVSDIVQQAYVAQKVHTADRWVAATALAHGFDLAAIDGIYDGIAGFSPLKPAP
jgi:predicted nucleic acid-binding protein